MSKRTGVMATTGIAVLLTSGLAGCALLASPGSSAPTPSEAPTTVVTPSKSTTPTVAPTTPSPSPTTAAPVKATGELSFHKGNVVSKAFVGTCVVAGGKPTITLADHKNDFYGTVDLTIVFVADAGQVAIITGDFGEDAELITRKLSYPGKGASAALVESDGVYRISGKAMLYENDSTTGALIPYSITAKCANSDWLG